MESIKSKQLKDLFNSDAKRADELTVKWEDFYVDFSKNRITKETLSLLFELANEINKNKTIVIDAGHGGVDFGASKEGLSEKALTEIISNKIQNRNENEDVKIHFTRTNDSFLDLSERVRIVNYYQPDLAISLHFNLNH